MSELDIVTIASAAASLQASQNAIKSGLSHLVTLESVIHDGLTGNADQWLKDQLLAVSGSIEIELRKAIL